MRRTLTAINQNHRHPYVVGHRHPYGSGRIKWVQAIYLSFRKATLLAFCILGLWACSDREQNRSRLNPDNNGKRQLPAQPYTPEDGTEKPETKDKTSTPTEPSTAEINTKINGADDNPKETSETETEAADATDGAETPRNQDDSKGAAKGSSDEQTEASSQTGPDLSRVFDNSPDRARRPDDKQPKERAKGEISYALRKDPLYDAVAQQNPLFGFRQVQNVETGAYYLNPFAKAALPLTFHLHKNVVARHAEMVILFVNDINLMARSAGILGRDTDVIQISDQIVSGDVPNPEVAKPDNINLIAFSPDLSEDVFGDERVYHRPPHPEHVPSEMDLWISQAFIDKLQQDDSFGINSLLRVPNILRLLFLKALGLKANCFEGDYHSLLKSPFDLSVRLDPILFNAPLKKNLAYDILALRYLYQEDLSAIEDPETFINQYHEGIRYQPCSQ